MFLNFEPQFIIMAQEDYKEYICSRIEGGCGFQVRAKTEDEIIEHAHMHQEMAHGVKESLSETGEKIKGEIRSV